jgi:hypothetical protein
MIDETLDIIRSRWYVAIPVFLSREGHRREELLPGASNR